MDNPLSISITVTAITNAQCTIVSKSYYLSFGIFLIPFVGFQPGHQGRLFPFSLLDFHLPTLKYADPWLERYAWLCPVLPAAAAPPCLLPGILHKHEVLEGVTTMIIHMPIYI